MNASFQRFQPHLRTPYIPLLWNDGQMGGLPYFTNILEGFCWPISPRCKIALVKKKLPLTRRLPETPKKLLPAGRLSEKSQNSSSKTLWFFFDASRRFNSWFQVRSSLHSPCPKQNQARRTIVNTLAAGKVQAPKVRWLKPEAVDLQVHFKSHPAVQVSSSIDFKMTWISEDPWGCLGKCSLIFDRLLGKNHVGE